MFSNNKGQVWNVYRWLDRNRLLKYKHNLKGLRNDTEPSSKFYSLYDWWIDNSVIWINQK